MNLRTENLVANKTRFSKLPLETLHTSGLKKKLIKSFHQLTLQTLSVAVIEKFSYKQRARTTGTSTQPGQNLKCLATQFNSFFLLSLKLLTQSSKVQGRFSPFHLFQKTSGLCDFTICNLCSYILHELCIPSVLVNKRINFHFQLLLVKSFNQIFHAGFKVTNPEVTKLFNSQTFYITSEPKTTQQNASFFTTQEPA